MFSGCKVESINERSKSMYEAILNHGYDPNDAILKGVYLMMSGAQVSPLLLSALNNVQAHLTVSCHCTACKDALYKAETLVRLLMSED